MRVLATLLLIAVASSSMASGDNERQRRNQQIHVQTSKAKAMAQVDGATVTVADDSEAAAIAPNPSAPAPSAQCRFGWSLTGAGVGFGAGVTGSEWDEICGLWLAAQQVTGEARKEAAAAAFCLTMKKASVKSPTCVDWEGGQGMTKTEVALDRELRPDVIFGGAGSDGN